MNLYIIYLIETNIYQCRYELKLSVINVVIKAHLLAAVKTKNPVLF